MPYNPETKLYTHGDKIDIPGQSIYDFVFEYKGSGKPQGDDLLWLIDSANGRTLTRKATLERTHNIARAFHSLGLGPDDALAIFSSNEVSDRLVCGAIARSRRKVPDWLRSRSMRSNESPRIKSLMSLHLQTSPSTRESD